MSGEMQWFRLYHRMVDDEKLRLLAFEDRWHFVALLCLKASGLLDEPSTDLRSRKIAVKLGVQVRELDEIARRLREVGLIDVDMVPVAWEELQYRSDNSTARVKKFREKQACNDVKRAGNVSVAAQETETEAEEEGTNVPVKSDDLTELVSDWNDLAAELGLPKVAKLTEARRRAARCRLKQNTLDEWKEAFRAIRRSGHCQGDNDRGWRADFDFLLQPKSFARLIEGFYDGKV